MAVSPVELLQALVRIDSSNPPGDERGVVALVAERLAAEGVESRVYAADDRRPNLVARVAGRGEAPPLLLHGHADVVPADPAEWRHPPFGGEIHDGVLWGRGALDMKGGLAMLVAAFARLVATPPPGDVVLVVNADEEAPGDAYGAAWLVATHPQLFDGVRHALGEFGGTTQHLGGYRLYPVQIAQRGRCVIRATVRGRGGHAASPRAGGVAKPLAELLRRVARLRLPVHVTPPARLMLEGLGAVLPPPAGAVARRLIDPRTAGPLIRLLGPAALAIEPILRNTVAPTIVTAGDAVNVLPTSAEVLLDGRMVPGASAETLLAELRAALPRSVELDLVEADAPTRRDPDLQLLALLSGLLREHDAKARPFPLVTAGVTDARHYDSLGIQTYGFLPMRLPRSIDGARLLHAPDERVPVAALEPGVAALSAAIERYPSALR